MRVNITGDKVEITDYINKLVDEKFTTPVDRLLVDFEEDEKIGSLRIVKRSRWGYKMIFEMKLPGREKIYADMVAPTVRTTLVTLRYKVQQQLRRYKGYIQKK